MAGALLLLQLRMRRAGGDAVFYRRALPALLEAATEGTGSSSTYNPPLPSPAVNAQPPITSLVSRGREEVAAADERARAQNWRQCGSKLPTDSGRFAFPAVPGCFYFVPNGVCHSALIARMRMRTYSASFIDIAERCDIAGLFSAVHNCAVKTSMQSTAKYPSLQSPGVFISNARPFRVTMCEVL